MKYKLLKVISVILLCLSVILFFMVLMIGLNGGRWIVSFAGFTISAGNAGGRMLYGAIALTGWYVLKTILSGRDKKWGRFMGRIVLLAFSISVSFLAAELAFRLYLRGNQSSGSLEDLEKSRHGGGARLASGHPLAAISQVSPNKILVYELMPNLRIDFGHKDVRLNSDGMRDSIEYPVERKSESVRIIGVGDSGMFGWAINQDEDFTTALESNLNRRADGILYEVMNCAVPGYNTYQEVEQVSYKGLKYKPDIVMVNWCVNDFDPPFFLMGRKQYTRRDVSYLYTFVFDRKRFQELIAPEVRQTDDIDWRYVDPEIAESSGESGVKKALIKLTAIAKENKFKPIVYGPMGQKIIGICKETGIDYFNTYDIPQAQYPDANIHGMHPRPHANKIIAEYMEKELEERGWIKGKDEGGGVPRQSAD